jgi:hypothetical protein
MSISEPDSMRFSKRHRYRAIYADPPWLGDGVVVGRIFKALFLVKRHAARRAPPIAAPVGCGPCFLAASNES